MGNGHRYTDEEKQWMLYYSQSQEWADLDAFFKAFNDRFGLNQSKYSLTTYVSKYGINVNTAYKNKSYTKEQINWIEENMSNGVFQSYEHFTDIFNAVFGTKTPHRTMKGFMQKRGWYLQTSYNQKIFTEEQEQWIKDNYSDYPILQDFTKKFNQVFGVDYRYTRLQNYLKKQGLRKSQDRKTAGRIGAQNQKGKARKNGEQPIGTIVYHGNKPFIKVKLYDGSSHEGKCSFREPYWMPLQKKIWEDHYGKVPEGFVVCSLNGDPSDTDINHIDILDKRMRFKMAKHGWWTENQYITGDGVQLCNLWAVAKDRNIL